MADEGERLIAGEGHGVRRHRVRRAAMFAGLALLLCCGVGLWIWSTGTFEVVETPEAAHETTQEIGAVENTGRVKPKH